MNLVRFVDTDGFPLFINPEKVIFVEDAARTSHHANATRVCCTEEYEPYVDAPLEEVAERLAGSTYLKTLLRES